MIEIITFEEWQDAIAPMWNMDNPRHIPILNNPYRMIYYADTSVHEEIIYFPLKYSENGVTKGYLSIYNTSPIALRYRGIYILPEHRGQGAGHRMCNEALELFPTSFESVYGFYKESGVDRFMKYGGMKKTRTPPLWSEFSQTYLHLLFKNRNEEKTDVVEYMRISAAFIDDNIEKYGLRGTNNDRFRYTDSEWARYVAINYYAYPLEESVKIDFRPE